VRRFGWKPLLLTLVIHGNVYEVCPNRCPLSGVGLMSGFSEKQVVRIWQHQLLEGKALTTEDGEPIRVVYPGRVNDGRGADFRDAVIATVRGLVKGDIELHVRSSGWRAHRHHLDPAYNRTILHVVMWHDTGGATRLQDGRSVPVLSLHKYIKTPVGRCPDLACSPAVFSLPCVNVAKYIPANSVAEFLDSAGEERFLAKASRFRADFAGMGAGQSLYRGIMGALGYSKNKLPCLELARCLPLKVLEAVARGGVTDEECLVRQQSLLLGTAGLLPSQRQDCCLENGLDDGWVDRLEGFWAVSGRPAVMSRDEWHLFKVRPSNLPVRRIAAMSYLVLRYLREGMLKGVVDLVKRAVVNKAHRVLEEGLLVVTGGYWSSRFDFGPGRRVGRPTLLGSGRAADIVVNVLLPFIFAWSQLVHRPELGEGAFDLYCGYPRLAANAVERHMKNQLGLDGGLVNSARRQQGLIHIYDTRCTRGGCNGCPLGHFEGGRHV
jgi:hypothetical protein